MSPDGEYIVICGKFGTIHLLKAKTKEWVFDLQMNNHVFDVSFSNDGKIMYSYSGKNDILLFFKIILLLSDIFWPAKTNEILGKNDVFPRSFKIIHGILIPH